MGTVLDQANMGFTPKMQSQGRTLSDVSAESVTEENEAPTADAQCVV